MEKTFKQTQRNIARIVLFGPESTGKTTLAKDLARYYNTIWVPEYLREFARTKYNNGQELVYEDNMVIAKGQYQTEKMSLEGANKYIICDTDILQTIVYSHEYYGKVQNELEEFVKNNDQELYLLLEPDIPWESDVLRDRPNDRARMFKVFESILRDFDKSYSILSGHGEERLKNAIAHIDDFFKYNR